MIVEREAAEVDQMTVRTLWKFSGTKFDFRKIRFASKYWSSADGDIWW
jgi:hypothetical protein